MMRFASMLFTIGIGGSFFAQKLCPVVGLDYQINGGTSIDLNQVNVHAGGCYNDRFFLTAHYGTNLVYDQPQAPTNFRFESYSFSGKVRLLSNKYTFSPMINLNIGAGNAYTGDTTYIGSEYTIVTSNVSSIQGYFQRIRSFGSLQLLADAQWRSFHFQLGGGLYFSNMNIKPLPSENPLVIKESVHTTGWVASATISYLIRFKD